MKHVNEDVCPSCEQKLLLADHYLVTWMRQLRSRYPSAHCSTAYRNKEDQEMAYSEGKSHRHYPDSAHNKTPAMALDIFQLNDHGQAVFDPVFCARVASENISNGWHLIWGGHFKSLGDYDHFEYNPHADT